LNILVISAHPDDEVLGMGGTIKKLGNKKNKIHLCVVSEGASAQYKDKKMIKKRKDACVKAGKFLGISSFDFFDFPDMRLDSISQLEINKKLEKVIKKFKPIVVYTTPSHDLNRDHQLVFESTLVATRPTESMVRTVLSYEIPGLVKHSFHPNFYEDISNELKNKIKAFKFYKSEVMEFPHPRSIKAIETIAAYRGIESGLIAAESFQLVRNIL